MYNYDCLLIIEQDITPALPDGKNLNAYSVSRNAPTPNAAAPINNGSVTKANS